jgi:hypothetical protein
MQTPLAAAVRAVVISPASMIARGSPVSGSLTTIRPEMYGSPRVVRVAGHPFERGDVAVAQVGGHGVDERIGPGMHARLGRHLNAPSRHRPVGVLGQLDLVKDGGKHATDRLSGEVQQRRLLGGHDQPPSRCLSGLDLQRHGR